MAPWPGAKFTQIREATEVLPGFWLFPTQFHESERSIIPSKRTALREIAVGAPKDAVFAELRAHRDRLPREIRVELRATLASCAAEFE